MQRSIEAALLAEVFPGVRCVGLDPKISTHVQWAVGEGHSRGETLDWAPQNWRIS